MFDHTKHKSDKVEVGMPQEVVAAKPEPKRQSPHKEVLTFLQTISQKIKNQEPKHLSVADDIDNFIRDHGNRHPEITKKEVL